ncbi:hypothetical protein GGR56DRAFT_623619, partial [Xylariaceae sp. FL0804]
RGIEPPTMDSRGIEPRTTPMLREYYTTKPQARGIPHPLMRRGPALGGEPDDLMEAPGVKGANDTRTPGNPGMDVRLFLRCCGRVGGADLPWVGGLYL